MSDHTKAATTCRCGGTGREWDFDHRYNSVDVGPCLECENRRLRDVMQSILDDADMAYYYERRQGDWFLLRLQQALGSGSQEAPK